MARDYGISAGYTLSYPLALTLMAFLAIAWYNVVELTILIFSTLRRSGLYFYSLLVATWGIVPMGMGYFLKFYKITNSSALYTTLIAIGWPSMVTGQSLVLYSRLNLFMHNTGRGVLIVIIVNAVICHVPIIILMYGTNCSPNPAMFTTLYSIYEKIQIAIFFIQEVMISGIYLYKTTKFLGSEGNARGRESRKVMTHLLWVNITIIALDITLLGLEYSGHYDIQTTYKAAVYSIKLKMEFSILNKLLDLFQGRIHDRPSDRPPHMNASTGSGANKTSGKSNTVGSSTVYSLGNSAYASMDDSPINLTSVNDREVLKTTEVIVERNDRASRRSISDTDVESVNERATKIQQTESSTRHSPRSSIEIMTAPHAY